MAGLEVDLRELLRSMSAPLLCPATGPQGGAAPKSAGPPAVAQGCALQGGATPQGGAAAGVAAPSSVAPSNAAPGSAAPDDAAPDDAAQDDAVGEYFPWECCEDCGTTTVGAASGSLNLQIEYSCPDCGRIFQRPSEEELALMDHPDFNGNVKTAPRLRVVGPDAMRVQRRLDRSFTANSDEAGFRDILSQLKSFNKEFHERTDRRYPEQVLKEVASVYVLEVRKQQDTDGRMKVKRGQNKQSMLAMLLFLHSQSRGWSREDAATFMQLKNGGLARGETKLRSLAACVDLLNGNREEPIIAAAFLAVGLAYNPHSVPRVALESESEAEPYIDSAGGALIEELKVAALELLEVGRKKHVGTQPIPKTRGTGAMFVALRRAVLAGRVPAGWKLPRDPAPGERGSLKWLAACCNIRTQTLEGFLATFQDFHRLFRPVYKKYGLHDGRVALF